MPGEGSSNKSISRKAVFRGATLLVSAALRDGITATGLFLIAAARLRLLAAGRAGGATLLHGGAAAFVVGAALQALLAAAEFHIGHAAGARRLTTYELLGAAVLRRIVSSIDGREQEAKGQERPYKQFRKHGMILQ